MILVKILFFTAFLLFLHSYILFPISLVVLYRFRKREDLMDEDYLPEISTITSVYNEQRVIEQKLNSVLESDYPKHKMHIYVGSDASSDDSNDILAKLAEHNSNVHFCSFLQRRGKSFVINDLMALALKNNGTSKDHILIFTDANVIFTKNTIKKLIRNFSSNGIALVDSRIHPFSLNDQGISKSENTYMGLEAKIKWLEGKLWGTMMGSFGGCFAVRSNFTKKVPPNFLMDDFFISMSVLDQQGICLSDLEAICYEGTPDNIKEEFKRKIRISAGNFQNLFAFSHFLFHGPFSRFYCFLSHKVIRWIGPFLLQIMFICCLVLSFSHVSFTYMLVLFCTIVFGIPLTDWVLQKLDIHIRVLRNIRYFFVMNFALFLGFIKYVKGIRNAAWEPPKRNK